MLQLNWRERRTRRTHPQARRRPASGAPGSRDRDYWVHVPRRPLRQRRLERPGVVMVLHGCDQTAGSLALATRFVEKAQAQGHVVVFPYVTSWAPMPWRARNCWGFWIEAERRRGEGEIGDLRRILHGVEAEFGTDPRRRYVAGLSSGGAMAVVYGDAIRAAGAVAGIAFGEASAAVSVAMPFRKLTPWFLDEKIGHTRPRLRPIGSLADDLSTGLEEACINDVVPLLVIQSTHDAIVQVENARMLRDVWIAGHGGAGDLTHHREALVGMPGERCSHVDPQGRVVVETLFYEGRREAPTHYWPGDSDAPPYANMTGPLASDALLDFFQRQGL